MLNSEQVHFFNHAGYLRLPHVFNEAEVKTVTDLVDHEFKEAQKHKLYRLYDRNPQLIHKVLTHPNLIEPLISLLGPNVVFVKNRHNHTTLNDAESTQSDARLHRDILQPSRGLITAVVYLEEATVENGCTHIIPGSQFFPYVGVPQANGGGTWMDEHKEYQGLMEQALPVPMPRGGVLLFSGVAFHSVGINRSRDTRRSITLGFRSVDELDYRPDFNRQILVAGKYIYRGNDID